MDHAGMSFVEAVEDLAQQFGMKVPEDDASPQDPRAFSRTSATATHLD
jgi:DNA primase